MIVDHGSLTWPPGIVDFRNSVFLWCFNGKQQGMHLKRIITIVFNCRKLDAMAPANPWWRRGHGWRAWAVGAMCVLCLVGASYLQHRPPPSGGGDSCGCSGGKCRQLGQSSELRAMCLCGYGKVIYYFKSSLRENCGPYFGSHTRIIGEGNFI